MSYTENLPDQQQSLTGDDLSGLIAGQSDAQTQLMPQPMQTANDSNNQGEAIDAGMRPETAQFLNNLASIGTAAYLDMRQADTPGYEDWRDGNFAADSSGNYVSPDGQTYADDELQQMHGVLSRQAGNPLVSRMFDGPKSQLADYMTWRNQNFLNQTGGGWEDEDGNLYTEPALQGMFAAKSGTASGQGGENQQSFTLPATDDTEQFFGGRPRFNANQTEDSSTGNNTNNTTIDFSRQKPPSFRPALSAAVGPGQPNRQNDVLQVQRLYNWMVDEGRLATANPGMTPPEKIPESGQYDAATAKAIHAVQQRQFSGIPNPFEVVTPDNSLFKSLAETVTGPNLAMNWISPEMKQTARMMLPEASKGDLNKYLPPLLKALQAKGLDYPAMVEYALATINAENSGFRPVSEGVSTLNTSPHGQPFDLYDGRNGNDQPGDGARFRGRGLIQLTGRGKYAQITRELKASGINVDLVKNPELANDDRYAPAIFAQYLSDHEDAIRDGLGTGADPQTANAAFQRYLDDTYDSDPTIRQALDDNEFVQARMPVNGHNRRGVPVNGLPNYLPSLRFGRAYGQIVNAAQQPNLTLGDVGQIWTQGDDAQQQEGFLQGLEKKTGVTRDTQLSDLSSKQRQAMENAQIQYVQQTMIRADNALKAKQKAQAVARRQRQQNQ